MEIRVDKVPATTLTKIRQIAKNPAETADEQKQQIAMLANAFLALNKSHEALLAALRDFRIDVIVRR